MKMKVITFTAKIAHASKEEDYYMIAFADDEFAPKDYIILQKAFAFDEQDVQLDMDGEYVEVNGQENSGYKCCKQAILAENKFVIELAADSGHIERVEVDLKGLKPPDNLRAYLTQILEGKLIIE